jgi:hypothetical protein
MALLAACALLAPLGPAHADVEGPLPIPTKLFSIMHPVGQQRLLETDYRQAYWPLATYFETQKNQAFCSVATSVIALNALGIRRPATSIYPDFPFFTQQDFFATIDPRLADPNLVAEEGMTLDQLTAVLSHFPVKVAAHPADTLSLEQFRELLRDTVRYDRRFALLNFDRTKTGAIGGGHWSPVGAYHPASDSALVLDVARYKYPPVWVPVADLYRAALSVDSASGKARGVLIVSGP